VCEYCSRTFHSEAFLNDHISTVHIGGIEHRCDQCGKVLGSGITLKIHQRQLHQRTCEQTCDGCGRQFARLTSLVNHLTHAHPHLLPDKYRSRLNDFACKKCDFLFSSRSTLQRHLEVRHGTASKYYVCPICSRRFLCQRYLSRHLRSHHPGVKVSAAVVGIARENSEFMYDALQQPSDDSSAV